MILAVKLVFTAATFAYALGYWYRIRNNSLHRVLMAIGFALTLTIAVVLVVGVHGFGETYAPAPWLVAAAGSAPLAHGVLVAHRMLATAALLVLIAQLLTGWRRHPAHARLARYTVPLWLATYGSGLVVFV